MRFIIELVLAALVVVALIVMLARRRKGDEIQSIDRYRNALGTLSDMRGTERRSYIKVLSPEEQRSARQPGAAIPRPSVPVPPTLGAKADEDVDFDDSDEASSASRLSHARHHDEPAWALDRMGVGPRLQNRQIVAAIIALVIVAVLVLVGIAIGRTPGQHHPTPTSTTTTTLKTHPTTTTTLTTLSANSQTATGADYVLPGASAITATVTVTTPCWTIATSGAGATQVYAAVIEPDKPATIEATQSLSISVAAPSNVSVVVNGLQVVMPQHLSIPTVLNFKATTPPSTSTTSTSTTSTTQVP